MVIDMNGVNTVSINKKETNYTPFSSLPICSTIINVYRTIKYLLLKIRNDLICESLSGSGTGNFCLKHLLFTAYEIY